MTRQLIEITFGNALTQASHLEQCADDMRRLVAGQLATIEDELHGSWEGDSADAYFSKMRQATQNMMATAQKLDRMASTIRRVAHIFRSSELRAIEIAERRDY